MIRGSEKILRIYRYFTENLYTKCILLNVMSEIAVSGSRSGNLSLFGIKSNRPHGIWDLFATWSGYVTFPSWKLHRIDFKAINLRYCLRDLKFDPYKIWERGKSSNQNKFGKFSRGAGFYIICECGICNSICEIKFFTISLKI